MTSCWERTFQRVRSDDEIPQEECWRLLATAHIGRVALSMKALPRILPVQYYLNDGLIFACLGSYRVPERSAHGAVLAFSADDIDPMLRRGWSVQAVGPATFAYHESTGVPADCGEPTGGQVVCIEPKALSGYRLNLCPFMTW